MRQTGDLTDRHMIFASWPVPIRGSLVCAVPRFYGRWRSAAFDIFQNGAQAVHILMPGSRDGGFFRFRTGGADFIEQPADQGCDQDAFIRGIAVIFAAEDFAHECDGGRQIRDLIGVEDTLIQIRQKAPQEVVIDQQGESQRPLARQGVIVRIDAVNVFAADDDQFARMQGVLFFIDIIDDRSAEEEIDLQLIMPVLQELENDELPVFIDEALGTNPFLRMDINAVGQVFLVFTIS